MARRILEEELRTLSDMVTALNFNLSAGQTEVSYLNETVENLNRTVEELTVQVAGVATALGLLGGILNRQAQAKRVHL